MKIKKVLFIEGAGFLHAITQTRSDALRWYVYFRRRKGFKTVELNDAEDVVLGADSQYRLPYEYVVSAEKHGVWFTDEFPFRAGLRFLFVSTVLSSYEESKLESVGILVHTT